MSLSWQCQKIFYSNHATQIYMWIQQSQVHSPLAQENNRSNLTLILFEWSSHVPECSLSVCQKSRHPQSPEPVSQPHFSIASSGFPLELWLMLNPLFQQGQLNEMMPVKSVVLCLITTVVVPNCSKEDILSFNSQIGFTFPFFFIKWHYKTGLGLNFNQLTSRVLPGVFDTRCTSRTNLSGIRRVAAPNHSQLLTRPYKHWISTWQRQKGRRVIHLLYLHRTNHINTCRYNSGSVQRHQS